MKKFSAAGLVAASSLLLSAAAGAGGYGAPYGHPGYGMPGPYGHQGYGAPGYGPQGYGAPAQAAPVYGQGGGQPAYGQRSYSPYGSGHAGSAQPTAARSETPAGAQSGDGGASVSVSGMRFSPAIVTVKKGESVTWDFADAMPHTVTARSGDFSSARMTAGGTFEHTFDEAGEFSYYCALHPNMVGKVVVEE